ncbi:MAG: hypothetical protein M3Z08_14600, partial [Chloroflexota bacterium]|nr:hypothetical protein [Chloroflexota bacterium]
MLTSGRVSQDSRWNKVPAIGRRPTIYRGKSHLKQDATWMKLKLTFKIGVPGSKTHRAAAAYPAADLLDTTFVRSISEPPYTGTDAAGNGYTDEYMWNFCGPGASTVSIDYWPNVNNRA